METNILLKELEGLQTIKSVMNFLNVDRKKAIYFIHRLRKEDYVKTKRLKNHLRSYYISFENKLKGVSYYQIINDYSPIKIAEPVTYKIYGRKPSLEETLVFAIKTKDFRTVWAGSGLFKKINNWSLLYKMAKKENLQRAVGALYDVSRTLMKTRKMSKRFLHLSLPKKNDKRQYIIDRLQSKDFKAIEDKWKVYVPFNNADLREYKWSP